MQMHEAAQTSAKTVRNQREMQGAEQLEQDQAKREASQGTTAVHGALGHFSERRYP